jgi:hypothetical protein
MHAVLYILVQFSLVQGGIKVALSIRYPPPLNVRKDPSFSHFRVRRTTKPMTGDTRTGIICTTI